MLPIATDAHAYDVVGRRSLVQKAGGGGEGGADKRVLQTVQWFQWTPETPKVNDLKDRQTSFLYFTRQMQHRSKGVN